MRHSLAAVAAALLSFGCFEPIVLGQISPTSKLLFTTQRLRRLKRDRERQTDRWLNFEKRIVSVEDSSERGFELALYYLVTGDQDRGREAVQWALAHRCETRQVALVLDWVSELVPDPDKAKLLNAGCQSAGPANGISTRDAFFLKIAGGQDTDSFISDTGKQMVSSLEEGGFQNPALLYAVCEYLSAVKTVERRDLREDSRMFFSLLPAEFLLGLRPSKIDNPDWTIHIAGLALLNLDPNMEGSQFLQGWAIEDRHMLREGPGVAYELLWGDPYLPGVGYQNLDPWVYDPNGRLFARTDWTSEACWIGISNAGTQQENCPPDWQKKLKQFGHLTLVPFNEPCTNVPHRPTNETTVLWNIKPAQPLFYTEDKQRQSAKADPAGLWRVSSNVEGNVCLSPDKLKVPQAHSPMRKER